MEESNFHKDLSNEELLSKHLDDIYPKVFKSNKFSVKRNYDLNFQHQGVDLTLSNGLETFYVDEKAQLDYLNSSLPTFAFEISYLKNNLWHKGWLFDETKKTDIYFLVTNIYTTKANNLKSGLKHIKITGVYRKKIIQFLSSKGLTESKLYEIENEIRTTGSHGRISSESLNPQNEGFFYFSKNNKIEQPINLVFKLDFLVQNNLGKILFKF